MGANSVKEAQATKWGKDLILKSDCSCSKSTQAECVTNYPQELMLKSNFTKEKCNASFPCAECGVPVLETLSIGKSFKCNANDVGAGKDSAVYRYMGNNVLGWYPSPEIAASWNPNWSQITSIDCAGMTKGDALTKKGV